MTTTAYHVEQELTRRGFKLKNGEWRGSSPFRPGSDSNAFVVKLEPDGEHGAYHDHVSQESGSLYDLAKAFNIALPERAITEVASTKRAYRDLRDYAAAHGVEDYVFEAAGWRCGELYGRPGLIYPTKSGERIRFTDGLDPAYKPLKTGYRNCWYGLSKAVERAKEQRSPLILCNGEASTVVAQAFGLPACAVTGGEKKFSDDLLAELRNVWNGAVVLAFDCDDTGRKAAADIALQLSDHPVKVIDLKLSKGGDLADFCKLQGDDSYKAFWALQNATPEHKAPVEQLRDSALQSLDTSIKQLRQSITHGLHVPDIEQLTARVQMELNRVALVATKPLLRSSASVATTAKTLVAERFKNPNAITGIPTGFPAIDKVIGGLNPATVTIIYGATSMGKSTMIASIFRSLYRTCSGLIVSTETPPENYMIQLAGAICRIPASNIHTGQINQQDYQRVMLTLDELETCGWTFLDSANPNATQLKSATLTAAQDPRFGVVLVDSISNMFNAGEFSEVVEVNNTIQQLARETRAAFIGTSQVSREMDKRPEGKKIPLLSDAYGGGVIENNADTVIVMYRHQYYVDQQLEKPNEAFPPNTGAAILRKTRGRDGLGKMVRLAYIGGAGFYPLAHASEREG